MSPDDIPADRRQHELDVVNSRLFLAGAELLQGAEAVRGLRDLRDLLLADFEKGVRAAVAEELRFLAAQQIVADWKLGLLEAARVAEIGLAAYSREDQPVNGPASRN